MIRTIQSVMQNYHCDAETAQRFMDLREEGYSTMQAALMAGLSDPPDPAIARVVAKIRALQSQRNEQALPRGRQVKEQK